MSTGFQLRQDNIQDDINKLKKPEGTKFTQIKSRGQNDVPSSSDPPKWAREGATKFTKWLSETSLAGDKMEIALAKMMIPAVKDPNVKLKECADLDANLNREVKVVKSVREKIKYNSEKTKLGWNDKEVTIWLLLGFDDGKGTYLLRFVGSVHVDGRSQKGVRLVEKEVSIWANAYLKVNSQGRKF